MTHSALSRWTSHLASLHYRQLNQYCLLRLDCTYSVVMTTLHSQSFTRSLKLSALNPANTAEWTAPTLAHARKAAAACQVIGRLPSAPF